MDRASLRLAAALVTLSFLIPGSLAAQIQPVGPETRADTFYFGPSCPHVAVGEDRSFEIVWDYNSLGDFSVHGRHFLASGEPTSPFPLNLSTGDFYDYSVVSSVTTSPGGFQAFYTVFDTQLEFPSQDFRQRLDLNGVPVGTAERVKPIPRVLAGPDGTLLATLYRDQAKNLSVQAVLPDGTAQGRRIPLSTRGIDQPALELAPLGHDGFAAAWSGLSTGKRPRQVIRARVVRNGVPLGQDFDVNTMPLGLKGGLPLILDLQVAGAPDGQGFAVVWLVREVPSNTSIHLRFFDAAGRPRTPERIVVPSAPAYLTFSAALDEAGDLLLLWRPPIQSVLRARLFSAATGAPLGPAYQIGPLDAFACGEAAWAGDSWIITYRTPGDDGHGAVVWRRFTE